VTQNEGSPAQILKIWVTNANSLLFCSAFFPIERIKMMSLDSPKHHVMQHYCKQNEIDGKEVGGNGAKIKAPANLQCGEGVKMSTDNCQIEQVAYNGACWTS